MSTYLIAQHVARIYLWLCMPPPTPTWQKIGDTTGTGNGALLSAPFYHLNSKSCMASTDIISTFGKS